MDPLPSNPSMSEQKQIHTSKGKPDGYYEAKYEGSNYIEMCFTKLDKNKKEITFLVNQLAAGENFAQMNKLDRVTSRVKDMQSIFDIISLNLQTRINYDSDILMALRSAKSTQTNASGIKTMIVVIMCAMQVFFITQFFKAGCSPHLNLAKLKPRNNYVELV